jgi:hypothetical protein
MSAGGSARCRHIDDDRTLHASTLPLIGTGSSLIAAAINHHDRQLVVVQSRNQDVAKTFSFQSARNLIPTLETSSAGQFVSAIAQREEVIIGHGG